MAISPTAPDHLLLATDSGILSSKNGGRDWTVEAPDVLVGAVFAVAYDADGARALASGASAIFRNDGNRWRATRRRLEPPRQGRWLEDRLPGASTWRGGAVST